MRGTLAPFFLASDSPIAIACLRLLTLLPLLPDLRVPFLRRRIALLTLTSTWQGSPDRGDIAISYLVLCAAGTMESIVGLSVTMLVLATLVMAIGAALQAAVGLGMALFVVLLLALIDVRLIPGLCCSHRWRWR